MVYNYAMPKAYRRECGRIAAEAGLSLNEWITLQLGRAADLPIPDYIVNKLDAVDGQSAVA